MAHLIYVESTVGLTVNEVAHELARSSASDA